MDDEQWLPVVGWEGLYEVSNKGQVRSVPRTFVRQQGGKEVTVSIPGRVLKQRPNQYGRWMVNLPRMENGSQKSYLKQTHIVVLEAFVGPRPEGLWGCHEDDDPSHNSLDNLAWKTPSQNRHDSVRNGTHSNARKTHCAQGHEFSPENTRLRPSGGRTCRTCERESNRVYAQSERGREKNRDRQRKRRGFKGPQTHCRAGHEYTDENTQVDRDGRRRCRKCGRIRQREFNARKRVKG